MITRWPVCTAQQLRDDLLAGLFVLDPEQWFPASVFPYAVRYGEEHPGLGQSRLEDPEPRRARTDGWVLRLFGGKDLAIAFTVAEYRCAVPARPTVYALGGNAEPDECREACVRIPCHRLIGPAQDIDPGIRGTEFEYRMTRSGFDTHATCEIGCLGRTRATSLSVGERTEGDTRIQGMESKIKCVLVLGLLRSAGIVVDVGHVIARSR